MKKHIFFDFNGTIINDLDLCLDLLNQILTKQNKRNVSMEEYKNLFTFPIRDYYIAAGVDFNIESYESLAKWFIKEYQPASMKCGLFEGIVDTFKYLKDQGYCLYILSASERNNLLEQCHNYNIVKYFIDILGIDNIHAASKVNIAIDYMKEHNIEGKDVLFIGDTLHDLEVANAMGAECMLVSCGHQSYEVLSKGNVKIIETINDLKEWC